MSQQDKLLAKILSGAFDTNISFDQLCRLLIKLGFDERMRGSHHIFTKEGVEEILNLQPKQVREVLRKYQLGGQDDSTV